MKTNFSSCDVPMSMSKLCCFIVAAWSFSSCLVAAVVVTCESWLQINRLELTTNEGKLEGILHGNSWLTSHSFSTAIQNSIHCKAKKGHLCFFLTGIHGEVSSCQCLCQSCAVSLLLHGHFQVVWLLLLLLQVSLGCRLADWS